MPTSNFTAKLLELEDIIISDLLLLIQKFIFTFLSLAKLVPALIATGDG